MAPRRCNSCSTSSLNVRSVSVLMWLMVSKTVTVRRAPSTSSCDSCISRPFTTQRGRAPMADGGRRCTTVSSGMVEGAPPPYVMAFEVRLVSGVRLRWRRVVSPSVHMFASAHARLARSMASYHSISWTAVQSCPMRSWMSCMSADVRVMVRPFLHILFTCFCESLLNGHATVTYSVGWARRLDRGASWLASDPAAVVVPPVGSAAIGVPARPLPLWSYGQGLSLTVWE